jgi:hypothetical protein
MTNIPCETNVFVKSKDLVEYLYFVKKTDCPFCSAGTPTLVQLNAIWTVPNLRHDADHAAILPVSDPTIRPEDADNLPLTRVTLLKSQAPWQNLLDFLKGWQETADDLKTSLRWL